MKQVYTPTTEEFPTTAEVVIIGGGIVGVASAFFLGRAGLECVVVEMLPSLASLTTPNSVECFRAQFSEPSLAELAVASIAVFEDFAAVVGIPDCDIALQPRGYLFATDDPTRIPEVQAAVEAHHRLGVRDSLYLDGPAARRRFPFLGKNVAAATFRQNDGWLSSHEATYGFARGSQARFLLQTRAIGIECDAQGVSALITERGTIHTRLVVNCAGPFAGQIARLLNLDLPLRPVRRQKAYIKPQSLIPDQAPMCIDLGRDAYWRPETGGALIGWVDPDEPSTEPAENLQTDRFFAAQAIEQLIPLFPFWAEVAKSLKSSQVITSAGHYVYTPDDHPLIGPVAEVPGFYLNCGYWAGVMLSPGAAMRLADLVTGRLAPADNPLRPTRFSEGAPLSSSSFLRGH